MSVKEANPQFAPLLLPAAEAAKLLSISERHFYKLHSSGRVPRPIRFGRAVRWRADELREWVAAGAPSRAQWQSMRKPRAT
jgi:excisionase family DNA binding protein